MKRFLLFITLVFLFASCGKDKTTVESEFRVELTYVGASRARITVAAMNMKAYYSYIQLSPQEEYYSSSAKEAIKAEVAFLEDAITYFENSNFTDAFCYREAGSSPFRELVMIPTTGSSCSRYTQKPTNSSASPLRFSTTPGPSPVGT